MRSARAKWVTSERFSRLLHFACGFTIRPHATKGPASVGREFPFTFAELISPSDHGQETSRDIFHLQFFFPL